MKITTIPLKEKVTVYVTPEEMWRCYMENMTDIMWDNTHKNNTGSYKHLSDTASVLLTNPLLNPHSVTQLFKDGSTYMLLHQEAMAAFDKPNIIREIIVECGYTPNGIQLPNITIHHSDINF